MSNASSLKIRSPFKPIIIFHNTDSFTTPNIKMLEVDKQRIQEMLERHSRVWMDSCYPNTTPSPPSQIFERTPPPSLPNVTRESSAVLKHTRPSAGQNPKRRRGNLPKAVTEMLKNWLSDHKKHPYPTEDEKTALAQKTGLTLNQVSNWFINARRRILGSMLEEDQKDKRTFSSAARSKYKRRHVSSDDSVNSNDGDDFESDTIHENDDDAEYQDGLFSKRQRTTVRVTGRRR